MQAIIIKKGTAFWKYISHISNTFERCNNIKFPDIKILNTSYFPHRHYAGSLVPMKYHHKNRNVQSIMLEINRKLYLKEPTNEKLFRNSICCLDYSMAIGGKLAAYSFDRKEKPDRNNFNKV